MNLRVCVEDNNLADACDEHVVDRQPDRREHRPRVHRPTTTAAIHDWVRERSPTIEADCVGRRAGRQPSPGSPSIEAAFFSAQ